jgi:L-ascorbate metabolism protein UlaG (beta-lactamase superfamily)
MTEKLANEIRNYKVENESIAVWGLGQMGVCIKDANQKIIFIDPILSDIVAETFPENAALFKREFEPPLTPNEIDFADLVLCTHEHLDHADPQTLAGIMEASPQAKFYTSHWAIDSLSEAGLDTSRFSIALPGEFLHEEKLTIHSIPSAHYDVEIDPQKGSRWLGFLLDWNGLRFYHSGDTILYPGFIEKLQTFSPIKVMMLAVNGRDAEREAMDIVGNLHLAEAYEIARATNCVQILAGHNDLFAFNSVDLDEERINVDHSANSLPFFIELLPGQHVVYRKG